jgi:hypothetical protein
MTFARDPREKRAVASDNEATMTWARRHRRKLLALGLVLVAPFVAHAAVRTLTPIDPPPVDLPDGPPRGRTLVRAGVRQVYLEGSPEQIGADHARLLRDHMVANEESLWSDFERFVPVPPLRTLIMDISRVSYRHVDQGIPEARRRELAAEARAFEPDPFASRLPTYHRMVFLDALYDISLSFEHSPLIGCTAFALGAGATEDGHVLMARAFDFEAGDLFDRDKAVFFVREEGAIPFASVSWPGLIGVVSGMNTEGVSIVVNGARAGESRTSGVPVVFSLREVLERAHDTEEALAILRKQPVMVSHIVFVADAQGHFARVERVPGAEAFVQNTWPDPDRVGVTNHLEGPYAGDAKNEAVRRTSSTLARRARIDELLSDVKPHAGSVRRAVAMLRDHTCAGGVSCSLGDRRTIDALIATHGIVADTTDRVLWVSAGPHLSGKFVQFDLREVFAHHGQDDGSEPQVIGEDPILFDGQYEAGRARAGSPYQDKGVQP